MSTDTNTSTNTRAALQEDDLPECRLLIVLHPNSSRATIVLSDRVFNLEKSPYHRTQEAVGAEKELIDYLLFSVIGLDDVGLGRNQLSLTLTHGTVVKELLPRVVTAVKQFCMKTDPSYTPVIYCQDKRWKVLPTSIDEYHEVGGIKYAAGEVNIGIPYTPWTLD